VERTWARRLRLLASATAVLGCTAVVLACMACGLAFRLWLTTRLPARGGLLSGLLTGVLIQLLGLAFRSIAHGLTEWECWATAAQHEDALIAKVFSFECVNNYSSLFYIAYVRAHIDTWARALGLDVPPSEPCVEGYECLGELELQLGAILLAKALMFKLLGVGSVRLWRLGRLAYDGHLRGCAYRCARLCFPAGKRTPRRAGPRSALAQEVGRTSSDAGLAEGEAAAAERSASALFLFVDALEAPPLAEGATHIEEGSEGEGRRAQASGESAHDGGPSPPHAAHPPAAERASEPQGRPPPAAAQCVAEAEMMRAPAISTVDEYRELVLMYGHLVLFASAFPLAPLLCLVSTALELRVDADKYCEARRPLPRAARYHPLWLQCAELLTTAAIVNNVALVLFTVPNALSPQLPLSLKVGLLLLAEHLFLLVRWLLRLVVPRQPVHVLHGMLEGRAAFERLHRALLDAQARGQGGGGGLSNLELMQLGLHGLVAQELREARAHAGLTGPSAHAREGALGASAPGSDPAACGGLHCRERKGTALASCVEEAPPLPQRRRGGAEMAAAPAPPGEAGGVRGLALRRQLRQLFGWASGEPPAEKLH
jgi:hypothetical protein